MQREERNNSLKEKAARLEWYYWAEAQPDVEVLRKELQSVEEWEFTRGQVSEPRSKSSQHTLLALAQKVREQGGSDIIDKYWSHLAQFESQEEVARPTYPLPLHTQRKGEPRQPEFVRYEEDFVGTNRAKEAKGKRQEWIAWAKDQPDAALLKSEFTFYQLWFYGDDTFYKFLSEEVAGYLQDQQVELQKLRHAGYGDIIERYWSHLLRYQPPTNDLST